MIQQESKPIDSLGWFFWIDYSIMMNLYSLLSSRGRWNFFFFTVSHEARVFIFFYDIRIIEWILKLITNNWSSSSCLKEKKNHRNIILWTQYGESHCIVGRVKMKPSNIVTFIVNESQIWFVLQVNRFLFSFFVNRYIVGVMNIQCSSWWFGTQPSTGRCL